MSFLKRYGFSFLLGLSAALLNLAPFAGPLEDQLGLSLLFRFRGAESPPPEVVLITIGNESAQALNSLVDPGQWSRFLHAEAVRRLKRAGAELIVFDIFFGDNQPGEDEAFANAMEEAGNVVLASQNKLRRLEGFYVETLDKPVKLLADAALADAPFLLVQGSESVAYLPWQGNGEESPTLPVKVLELFLERTARDELLSLLASSHVALPVGPEADGVPFPWGQLLAELEDNPQRLALPAVSEPVRRALRSLMDVDLHRGNHYFDHYGLAGTLTRIPYHRILLEDQLATVDLRGKIALVGFSEDYPSADFILGTLDSPYSSISTLELCATALADLLENRTPQPLFNPFQQSLFLFGWGILLGSLSLSRTLSAGLWSLLIIAAAYLAVATILFRFRGAWLPVSLPLFWLTPVSLIACLVANYWKREEETRKLIKAIRPILPRGVWDDLARGEEVSLAKGRMAFGVCLATDAGCYTALAEKMEPMELGELMDEYYGTLFPVVSRHGGRVSDVVGDAMLAIWEGAQVRADLRTFAANAALRLMAAVDEFQRQRDIVLPIRIGVHCGDLRIGFVGASEEAQFFRAVGDTVNTSARLESLNKLLGTRIIVSETLISDLEGFVSRPLGSFQLPGREQAVAVHELVGRTEDVGAERLELLGRFGEALAHYQAERHAEAAMGFQGILDDFGEDGPSRFYLNLLNAPGMAKMNTGAPGNGIQTSKPPSGEIAR